MQSRAASLSGAHRFVPDEPREAREVVTSHLRIPLFRNAYALVVSGVASTVVGLAFWALAARCYPAAEVGRAASAISAMTMLTALLQLNLNTGLMRFLPEAGRFGRALLLRAYAVTTATTTAGAIVVVLLFSGHSFLAGLGAHPTVFKILFVISVPLWSAFVMQDAALIGLRSAVYVPIENLAFAIAKLGLLIALVSWSTGGLLAAWILPAGLLIVPVTWLILARLLPSKVDEPATVRSWSQVRRYLAADFSGSFLETLAAATVPILVSWRLGLVQGAYFYTSWVVLVGIEMVLGSIGSSLTVEGAHDRPALLRLRRSATALTAAFVAAAVTIGLFAAPLLLSIIGSQYAAHGTTLFRLLLLAIPFRAVVVLRLSTARVERRGLTILIYQGIYALLLFVGCSAGLGVLGIDAVGWVFLCIQILLAIAVTIERRMRPERHGRHV
jgi:O-antigen/teichoic acid export membrane protein